MAGKKLTTIYSVGEGRTLVLASDGCRLCLAAFSILINSSAEAPSSGEDEKHLKGLRSGKPAERSLLDTPPWLLSAAADKRRQEGPLGSPGSAGAATHLPLALLSLREGEEGGAEGGSGSPGPGTRTTGRSEGSPGKDAEGRKERGGRGGEEKDKKGADKREEKEKEKKGGDQREEKKGAEHKEGKGKRGTDYRRPRALAVFNPAKEEGEAPAQDLRLRSTDRLIVALYTHPSHLGLPAVPHVAAADAEHRGLGAKLKSAMPKSAKEKEKEKEKERGGIDSVDDWDDLASLGLPPAHPKPATPKLGPGDTFILNPAEWEDVEASLELWGSGRSRDSLARMAQAARDKKIRFEAIQIEELAEDAAEGEGGAGVPGRSLLPSTKKKSSELGQSLVAFCAQVEASLLLLGVHHAHHAHELKSKSFLSNFSAYCLDHCHCSVRAVAGGQVKGPASEPSTPNDSFKSKHSVIDAIVTAYVRDC